jgi:hypothetical protein
MVYMDGPKGQGQLIATVPTFVLRPDVNTNTNATGSHGFSRHILALYLLHYSWSVYRADASDPQSAMLIDGAPTSGVLWQPPSSTGTVQLLRDTNIADGLRAWWSCVKWSGDRNTDGVASGLRLGDCLAYEQPLPGFSIYTWPDTGAPSDHNKYWNLNEGQHWIGFGEPGNSFYVPSGNDLQVFRTEANGELLSDTPKLFLVRHVNNIGLSAGSPLYGTRIARQFESDRHGTVTLYGNTFNEIQNDAVDNGSRFARDTWPHFYLDQNFRQLIDMGDFSSVQYSEIVSIPFERTLPGWKSSYQNATYSMVAFLRRKDIPKVGLFLQYSPFSRNPLDYQEKMSVEQNGIAAYRGDIAIANGPLTVGGPARTISFDITATLQRAIALQPSLGKVSDYYLAGIENGWELLGYQEYKSVTSSISLIGTLGMPSAPPIGYFDGIGADATIVGWTLDPDTPSQSTTVAFYADGVKGQGTLVATVPANQSRLDVNSAQNVTGDHGFSWQIPAQYLSAIHSWYAYGIDSSDSSIATLLIGSPKSR